MARKYTGGAEFNAGATADMDYDSTSGTTITYDNTTVRNGGFSWKFVTSASGPFLTRQYNTGNHDSYVRAYINVSSMTTASSISILLIRDATNGNNIDLRLTRTAASTFTLAITNEQASAQVGNTSPTLNTNQWYRVEFSYVFSSGAAAAYIDGQQFATGAATASIASNTLRWGSIDASTMTIFFDDIAVNDETAGGTQTGLPGPGHVVRLKPLSAGDANTFGSGTNGLLTGGTAGVANNFTRVKEVLPDDATTFNGSAVLNEADFFKVDATTTINAMDTINVVEIWGRFRNSVADATESIKFQVEQKPSGTVTQGPGTAIIPNSTTWKMNALAVPKTPPIITYVDTAGVPWTVGTLNTMQIGYKTIAGPATATHRIDVTSVSAIVEYVPYSQQVSQTNQAVKRGAFF